MAHRFRTVSFPTLYFLALTILLAVFFELWRGILLLLLRDLAPDVPTPVLARSFLVGLRFDLSVASYLVMPLLLLGMIPYADIGRSRLARHIVFIALTLLAGGAFLLSLVDIEFFRFFNARLNGIALNWIDTPGWVAHMIWETYPVVAYLMLWLAVWACFVWLAWWFSELLVTRRKHASPVWVNTLWATAALAVLALGARGRVVEKAPLRWGAAYFSEYQFANQLALNSVFTFVHDAVYIANEREEIRLLTGEIAIPEAEVITRQMLGISPTDSNAPGERICRQVRPSHPNDHPPDVILIIMESFAAVRIGALDNKFGVNVSPCFDSVSQHGLLFTNFYSSGSHTFTGLFCSLMGYPHLVGKLLGKEVTGQDRFCGLPSILSDHGYRTLFFTTHDPHFDNMQGFLMANGVQQVISVHDYDPHLRLSTLGVPDHIMFDRAVEELKQIGDQRYFVTLLTGSNHGPWKIPDIDLQWVPESNRWRQSLNAFKYSDWALGRFLRAISRDTAFANTLIIVTADNGVWHGSETDLHPMRFHIPLLIYNTDWGETRGRRIEKFACQLDIPATVMGLVRLPYDNYTFGSDLLDTTSRAEKYAYFCEWHKLGLIQDSLYVVQRLRGRRSIYQFGDYHHDLIDSLPHAAEKQARKALAIFQTAYHNMHRPLKTPPPGDN